MMHCFEEDPRTQLQLQADLDCLDVTISMYAVDDHDGKRKAGSVFRAEQDDWNAVTGTYRQFKAESGFDHAASRPTKKPAMSGSSPTGCTPDNPWRRAGMGLGPSAAARLREEVHASARRSPPRRVRDFSSTKGGHRFPTPSPSLSELNRLRQRGLSRMFCPIHWSPASPLRSVA